MESISPPYKVIPVTETIPLPAADPYTLFCALDIRNGYILESMEGVPRRAVRSIIGLAPDLIISLGSDPRCQGRHPCSAICASLEGSDPVSQLRALTSRFRVAGPRTDGFTGGFVGYCTYDMVTTITGGRVQAGRDALPLARFMLSTRGIVYDHVQGSCLLFDDLILPRDSDPSAEYERAVERLGRLKAAIQDVRPKKGSPCRTSPAPSLSSADRSAFESAVVTAKEHIMAGDIFQVVLARKITCPFQGDPREIYGRIRDINPSPYLYYLRFDDEAIIGSSPEMLVKSEGREFQTVPIAGTRPRGKDPEEDARFAADLLADAKERAEHLMLVDLARNDIGKVAAFGSVSVPEFMEIEKFSHVQHIVSKVSGVLAEGRDRFDALAACFPAGTVSGAPKIRAMQIIADLEPVPRGLYAGAVGYATFDDLLEFAIAIRTVRVKDGRAEYFTGAGIVADSVPEREFEETEHKAQAMITAILQAGDAP
ncbi:MAG TPA: anthranilate synthase component I family protein [Methanoregulaceae archaeon]|jgi:anthranilate synthase component 1|nr:anthranilate synthase component I family protein [Methanoregulaceae archaeon]